MLEQDEESEGVDVEVENESDWIDED